MGGHWEDYEADEIDSEVQAYITKCQNLMLAIGRIAERANNEKLEASEAISTCKDASNVQSEDLSGIYYEDYYIPFREKFFTEANLIDECDGCLAEAQERISTLSSLVAAKMPFLHKTVVKQRWVED